MVQEIPPRNKYDFEYDYKQENGKAAILDLTQRASLFVLDNTPHPIIKGSEINNLVFYPRGESV